LNESVDMNKETQPVTMYSTTWCGYCRRLKRQMEEAGIPHHVIDVDEQEGYDERIIAATGGYRVVPTLEVGGRLLVNPTIREVEAALAA
jgi:mycoredoxin